MKRGDVVISKNGPFSTREGALRSGSEHYTHAICVSVEPFALVSEEGDMLWSMQSPADFVSLCQASWRARRQAFGRWSREQSRVNEGGRQP